MEKFRFLQKNAVLVQKVTINLRFLVIGSEIRSRFDRLFYVDGFISYYSSFLHNSDLLRNVKLSPSLKSFISLKTY